MHLLQPVPIMNTVHTGIGIFLGVCVSAILVGESLTTCNRIGGQRRQLKL
jgi:multidrug transporter EmrE-like cation transporter